LKRRLREREESLNIWGPTVVGCAELGESELAPDKFGRERSNDRLERIHEEGK
jgi:hypothetical protein